MEKSSKKFMNSTKGYINESYEREGIVKPQEKASKKVAKCRITLSSNGIKGNVEIPEICIHSINNQCPREKEGCSRLHASRIWHWQLIHDQEWLNFTQIQSDCLEKAFQKVDIDEVLVPVRDILQKDKLTLALMDILGKKSLQANFTHMTIQSFDGEKAFKIRRLSTPSSTKCKSKFSSEFGWFYKGNKEWVEFEHRSNNSEKQTTSSEIEMQYQKNPKGSMFVTIFDSMWKLEFDKMEIRNKNTKQTMPLRRRPKHCDVVAPAALSYQAVNRVADATEICVTKDGKHCSKENGCHKLHSKHPWHWQVSHNDVWYNLPQRQTEALERAYRDTSRDSVEIPTLSTSYKGQMANVMMTILGSTKCIANFDKMTIIRLNREGNVFHIRRLSTPSSVVSATDTATEFVWYYWKKKIWVKFNSSNNLKDISDDFPQQTTVKDIEKAFLSKTAINVNILEDTFTLDFSTMTLYCCNPEMEVRSKILQETMPVRRRPKGDSDFGSSAVWSYYIQGDVPIAEICLVLDGDVCPKGNCGRLHSQVPWHWQVFHNNCWYNFGKLQASTLEEAYTKKKKNRVVLQPINPSKMGKMGVAMTSVLGIAKWEAKFDTMNITKLDGPKMLLEIRRLPVPLNTTPASPDDHENDVK